MLGARVRTTGQILVLSAEDLREHLFKRIGGIAGWMGEEAGWTDEQVEDVCSRIHVMPFLSMSATEFAPSSPSLFERGTSGDWAPTQSLVNIEAFIDDWNAQADAEGRPEDRFVGVVLDSAVSMAGFEMSNSEAATNFLFYLNRMSRRQRTFWAIIGHTPKDAGKKGEESPVERLRGSAMWSTTPRAVIELRCAGSGDNVDQVLVRYPELEVRDVLFLSTVKANSIKPDLRPRALMRVSEGGGFIDISEEFPTVFDREVKASSSPARQERLTPVDGDRTWRAIIEVVAQAAEGGSAGTSVSRRAVRDEFERQQPANAALRYVTPEHEGKQSRTDFSLAWYLAEMRDFGAIKHGKPGQFVIVDLGIIRRRFSDDETGTDVELAPQVIDDATGLACANDDGAVSAVGTADDRDEEHPTLSERAA